MQLKDMDARDRSYVKLIVQKLHSELKPKQYAQSFRLQLRKRKRKDGELLLSLSKDIRRLAIKAYPDAPKHVVEDIAVDHFVEALSSFDLRMQICRGNPHSLTEAVTIAQFEEGMYRVDEDRNSLGRRFASSLAWW